MQSCSAPWVAPECPPEEKDAFAWRRDRTRDHAIVFTDSKHTVSVQALISQILRLVQFSRGLPQ